MSDTKVSVALDPRHFELRDFTQRMTTSAWKRLLLEGQDQLVFCRGQGYRLKATKVFPGVVEVSKAPLDDPQPKRSPFVPRPAAPPAVIDRAVAQLLEAKGDLEDAQQDGENAAWLVSQAMQRIDQVLEALDPDQFVE